MHAIAHELSEDWAGPYTDTELLQRTLKIIKMVDPEAEIVSRDTDPYADQILGGLRPYKIHVDLQDGVPLLPAEVQVTWPPESQEGIVVGTPDYQDFFVWAKNEKDALLRLARINKAAQAHSNREAAATTEQF